MLSDETVKELVDKYAKIYNLKGKKVLDSILSLARNKNHETKEEDIRNWIKHQKESEIEKPKPPPKKKRQQTKQIREENY